jgi:tetratricopeptide (TPR) repeat protein
LVAAIATAAAAVATLIFRELARRRTDLDQKVTNAVSASIGNTLISLREFESRAKTSLDATVKSAADIEQHLKERLDISEKQTKRLSELLEKASNVVPTLETSRAAIPSLLLAEARRASNPEEALSYLSSLLANDQATPQDLETGGDLAKEGLGADALALALFEKATKLNQALVGSRAVAIQMRARAGTLSLDDARLELSELAMSNLRNRRVLVAVSNHFSEYEDWQGMLGLLDQLLEQDRQRALLWRNRGVALDRLGRLDEAAEAYARAYSISQESGDITELSNSVKPYAPFLMAQARYEEAQAVLEEALVHEPDGGWILRQLGELRELLHEDDRASKCYEAALRATSNPTENALVRSQLTSLVARRKLVAEGILSVT